MEDEDEPDRTFEVDDSPSRPPATATTAGWTRWEFAGEKEYEWAVDTEAANKCGKCGVEWWREKKEKGGGGVEAVEVGGSDGRWRSEKRREKVKLR